MNFLTQWLGYSKAVPYLDLKGKKGKGLGICYSASLRDSNSSALQSRKCQLIGMS